VRQAFSQAFSLPDGGRPVPQDGPIATTYRLSPKQGSKERKDTMITPGTILMAKDTLRPSCFQLEDDPCPNAWMSVKHNLTSYELEKELATEGWTFFYMATVLTTTAFGFDRGKMIHAALSRLIANTTLQKCNSLEIDTVTTRSFLGVPYVSVSAHPRHIQKNILFSRQ